MRKLPRNEREWDQLIARAHYGQAVRILIPALLFFSILATLMGRHGGAIAYLSEHWILGPGLMFCIAGLVLFAVSDIRKGWRRSRGLDRPPHYETHSLGKNADGSTRWELRRNGHPYAQVDVGSISEIIRQ